MKTLYIECNMGAAGDMLMAALLELHPDPDAFLHQMNHLGLPGVHVAREAAVKCGITGTYVTVRVQGQEEESHDVEPGHSHAHPHEEHCHHHGHGDAHHHHGEHHHSHEGEGHSHTHEHSHEHAAAGHSHTGMAEIGDILAGLPVSQQVKKDALAVYGLIADAEAKAHGKSVEAVHFHEVGMMDAVADVVGVCLLMEALSPQRIVVSPVHVGSGQVKCAHGVLPVPAPATASILQGVPTYGGQVRGELCTPTGAALLKHFAHEFGPQPLMSVQGMGYGMGKKDFPMANCVRVFLGEDTGEASDVVEVVCNLDDMTGEALGFALEVLMEEGALDVCLVPVHMKKGRPGQLLLCLCRPQDEEKMVGLILRHTTTFGVRSSMWRRHTLERSIKTIETDYGPVRCKTGTGFGVEKRKAEYEDLARLAREKGVALSEISVDVWWTGGEPDATE